MEKLKVPGRRLGRKPKVEDKRSLRLLNYFIPSPPPASIDLTSGITTWPMYANDRLGDCTCAAPGHMEEVWSYEEAGSPILYSDDDIIALYNKVNGGVDEGANMVDVLREWRNNGLKNDKIFAYAYLSHRDQDSVKSAAWTFTGLYIGVNLPDSAQHQEVWDVGSEPGSWGGHAINVVGYDDKTLTVVTWGKLKKMTWGFWDKYVDEVWAIIPAGVDLKPLTNQIDFQALQKDLQNLDRMNG